MTATRALRSAAPLALALALALTLCADGAPAQEPEQEQAQSPAPAQDSTPRLTEALLEPFRYRLIGPANQGGRITAIAVPETPGRKTMYIGAASGGVWKTTNNGTTWEPVFDDGGFASIGDVAVSTSNPEIVWVGTGERNSLRSAGWGDGVYRSTDGGGEWEHMGLADSRSIGRIVIHPTDPDIVYVAAMGHLWGTNGERGVFKTTDGGETWEKVLFVNDTTAFVDLKMDPSNPDVLYAAGWHRLRFGGGRMQGAGEGSGIWKTTDGGGSWVELTDPRLDNGLPTERMGRIGLGISRQNPSRVYAIIQVAKGAFGPTISQHGGLFRSDDAGESWTRVHDFSARPDYYYNEVWLDPNDDETVYLPSVRLAVSHDAGLTFEDIRMRGVHVDHHSFWVDPDDSDRIVLGNDGGIYFSYDGGRTWAHHPMPIGQFYEVDVDTTRTPYHVCGGLQDNGIFCGPSRTRERIGITLADWYRVHGGDGFRSAVSPDSPDIRFGESQFGNITRLDVKSWTQDRIQPHAEDAGVESGYAFRFDWNSPLVISQHDPTVIYFGGNHLFKFTDRGRNWEILGPDMSRGNRYAPEPDSTYTSYRSLHSIAESPLDPDLLWTGSNDGLIWVTTDGGATWRNVTANIPDEAPKHCWVEEIEASRFDAGTAYVVYDCHRRDDYQPYVYRTTDGGETFTNITGDLPEHGGSYVIREDAVNADLLFVGTEQGVWLSIHGGNRWTRLKNNLPTVAVRDLDLVARARELVVGTYGRSIYVLDIGPLEELADSVLARQAHLFQVEPARHFNVRNTYASRGNQFFTADNPEAGAVITYYLREDVGKEVTLTIRKQGGEPAAPVTAADAATATRASGPPARGGDGGEAGENGEAGQEQEQEQGGQRDDALVTLTGSGRPGIHRVTWDLRAEDPRPRALGDPIDPDELRIVLPGSYTVTLRAGEFTQTRTIVVEHGWPGHVPGRVR